MNLFYLLLNILFYFRRQLHIHLLIRSVNSIVSRTASLQILITKLFQLKFELNVKNKICFITSIASNKLSNPLNATFLLWYFFLGFAEIACVEWHRIHFVLGHLLKMHMHKSSRDHC